MEQKQEENLIRILHTELPDEVFRDLKYYAQSLSTARGYWDFGVAIKRLLDLSRFEVQFKQLEERIIFLEGQLINKEFEIDDAVEEYDSIEMLGGYKIKGEKKNGKN